MLPTQSKEVGMIRREIAFALILICIWPLAILKATFVDQRIFDVRQAIYDGRCHEAVALAKRYLESEPKDVTALSLLGSAHFLLANYPDAIAAWQDAIKFAPNDVHVKAFLELAEAAHRVRKRPTQDLIADLGSKERIKRLNAEIRLSVASHDILPELVANSTHTNVAVRAGIAGVLGDIYGPQDAIRNHSIPALIRALTDNDPGVRAKASNSLGKVGVLSDKSVHALMGRLKDPSPEVRKAAEQAIALIEQAKVLKSVPPEQRCLEREGN